VSAEGRIFSVFARARNGTIGAGGQLPWHIPADFKHFKALTIGKPMVMGRKTFESLPGLLPGRRHIVLTRDPDWRPDGAELAHSAAQALAMADTGTGAGEVAIIGGAQVYALFEPHIGRIELTEIHAEYPGDTRMPAPGPEWREIAREEHAAEAGRPGFAFVTLVRAL
jgi:dihydrofolate reductase